MKIIHVIYIYVLLATSRINSFSTVKDSRQKLDYSVFIIILSYMKQVLAVTAWDLHECKLHTVTLIRGLN